MHSRAVRCAAEYKGMKILEGLSATGTRTDTAHTCLQWLVAVHIELALHHIPVTLCV